MLSKLFSHPNTSLGSSLVLKQWSRSIRVKVRDNDLDRALAQLQRKMTGSGIERIIKADSLDSRHVKNSERRVMARKNLRRKLDSMELAAKLKAILLKKVRGL